MKILLIMVVATAILSGCFTRVIVCGEWQEIKTADGRVYSERACRE